jgi:hypothetical protein
LEPLESVVTIETSSTVTVSTPGATSSETICTSSSTVFTDHSQEPYTEWRPPGYFGVAGEPEEVFKGRMRRLKEWLLARPEKTIVLGG